jgi:hypothetical protein
MTYDIGHAKSLMGLVAQHGGQKILELFRKEFLLSDV